MNLRKLGGELAVSFVDVRVDSLERRSLYGPYLKNLKDTVLQVTEMQEQERDKRELDTIYINRQIVLPAGMRSGRYGVLTGVVTDENSGRAVEANIPIKRPCQE